MALNRPRDRPTDLSTGRLLAAAGRPAGSTSIWPLAAGGDFSIGGLRRVSNARGRTAHVQPWRERHESRAANGLLFRR